MGALTTLRYWREISIGLLILAGVGLCRDRDARIAADAVQEERIEIAESRAAAFEQAAAYRDTVFVTDTIRLTKLVTAYETVRVRDTAVRNDTVFVAREVADAAIAACEQAINSCVATLEAERAVSTNLRDQLALASREPGFWVRQYERWDGPAWGLLGWIVGRR